MLYIFWIGDFVGAIAEALELDIEVSTQYKPTLENIKSLLLPVSFIWVCSISNNAKYTTAQVEREKNSIVIWSQQDMYYQCLSLSLPAWETFLKFDITAGNSYH